MYRTGTDEAGNRTWRRGYAREAAAGGEAVGRGPGRPEPTCAHAHRGRAQREARGHAAAVRPAAWRQQEAPRRFRLPGTRPNSPRLLCRLGEL